MKKIIAALALTTAVTVGCDVYPSGCVRIATQGQASWEYDGPTDTWWNELPPYGLIGYGIEEDTPVWDTWRCAATNGAQR